MYHVTIFSAVNGANADELQNQNPYKKKLCCRWLSGFDCQSAWSLRHIFVDVNLYLLQVCLRNTFSSGLANKTFCQ